MSEEVDFWGATIAAFAPLQIASPELTPKLLKRPPFRFIWDIITGVNARFAAYDHIIPSEFSDVATIDSREKKIAYLQCIITYVEKLLNLKIDVDPKKIVAGREPEKTNVFLQYVAAAVGYAQQDKAKNPATATTGGTAAPEGSADAPPPPPPPPPPASDDGAPPPPPPPPRSARVSSAFAEGLPNPGSLPRKKSSSASQESRAGVNQEAIQTAEAFNKKLAGFAIKLDGGSTGAGDIVADGQSIVKMWQELQNPKVDTTPATMPEEALETAIKRQLDVIKQFRDLMAENDEIVERLEDILV